MGKEHVAALKATEICRLLSDAEMAAMAEILETRTVAPGTDLFREGDAGDGLFLVVSGEIDVVKRGPAGERSLARLNAGAVLGEMALITSEPRSATCRAVAETLVLRLPAGRFRALRDGGSAAAYKIAAGIAEVLARRLAAMNTKVIEFTEKMESGGATPHRVDDKELAELHRTLQVWSF
jgi:CRP-like cAMP-binding protein